MALYTYKAMTRGGDIVQNRVEEANRFALLKKLKDNQLLPISVTQVLTVGKTQVAKKQKRNIETTDSVLKEMRQRDIIKRRSKS